MFKNKQTTWCIYLLFHKNKIFSEQFQIILVQFIATISFGALKFLYRAIKK